MGQKYKRALGDVYEPACSVNRQWLPHDRCARLCGELPVGVSSKESLDPCELDGEKILLSDLLGEFSELAEVLSRRKE